MTAELDLVGSDIASFVQGTITGPAIRGFCTRAIMSANEGARRALAMTRAPSTPLVHEPANEPATASVNEAPLVHIDIAERIKTITLANLLPVCQPLSEVVDKLARQAGRMPTHVVAFCINLLCRWHISKRPQAWPNHFPSSRWICLSQAGPFVARLPKQCLRLREASARSLTWSNGLHRLTLPLWRWMCLI